jgi:ABC-type uncharacterized transport system substrate-binding protein
LGWRHTKIIWYFGAAGGSTCNPEPIDMTDRSLLCDLAVAGRVHFNGRIGDLPTQDRMSTMVNALVQNRGFYAAMLREHADALLMTNDPFHQRHIQKILAFLAENRMPGMFQIKENVLAGGFMSYGASLPDLFRRGASYVHKILQGTRPADLPVEQPTKFELVINVKTAKAIGVTVPESILLHADEVIE